MMRSHFDDLADGKTLIFELSGFIKVETRGEQGCIEEQPDQVPDSLVTLVGDLHGLLRNHVGESWNCHEEPEPS